MSRKGVSAHDLTRDLGEVARARPEWRRGDHDEAIAQTLRASARDVLGRDHTVWVWPGRTSAGEAAWAVPVTAAFATAFSPPGPARALARSLAAAVEAGAPAPALRLCDWRGLACVVAPGADPELAGIALAEAHPDARHLGVEAPPASVALDGPPLPLPPFGPGPGVGLVGLARAVYTHPVRVALALLAHGLSVDDPSPRLARSLREWGCAGTPEPEPPTPPSLALEDDPCPRRRHARRVLRRLLRMGKIGNQYHTEFSHLYRGAAPEDRRAALEVGEALVRAGLLGEKPSVGQRHVFLRREALPAIHALIERGETRSPGLEEMWTAPAPGAGPGAGAEPPVSAAPR